jgi:HEAT repeat protein
LLRINPGYPKAINVLIHLLDSQDALTRLRAAQWLVGHQSSKQEAIKILIEVLEPSYDDETRIEAATTLVKVIPDKQKAINVLIELLSPSQPESIRIKAADGLLDINPSNQDAINVLIDLLKANDVQTRLLAANSLGKINPNNLAAINTLINSLHTDHAHDWDWYIYSQSAFFLKNLLQENTYPIVVARLKNCLWLDVSQPDHDEIGRQNYCFEVLWHCAKNMTYPKFCEVWRNQKSTLHPEVLDNIALSDSPTVE